MTLDEAIRYLRLNPPYEGFIRDSYLDEDVTQAADRFRSCEEFLEASRLMGLALSGGSVLDLGAGNGIASFALASSGASTVYALDPNPSVEVGLAALQSVAVGLPVVPLAGVGEAIPLAGRSIDVVYVRQVLHHAADLPAMLRECSRVLRRGGVFLACREHVVDDDEQLARFQAEHPVDRLAGGENAFSLPAYLRAIEGSGLRVQRVVRPWESVINAFPSTRTKEELDRFPIEILERKLGAAGKVIAKFPWMTPLVRELLNRRRTPGRLYTFLASKP